MPRGKCAPSRTSCSFKDSAHAVEPHINGATPNELSDLQTKSGDEAKTSEVRKPTDESGVKERSVGLLDLPPEIRNMIYELSLQGTGQDSACLLITQKSRMEMARSATKPSTYAMAISTPDASSSAMTFFTLKPSNYATRSNMVYANVISVLKPAFSAHS